MRNERHAVLFIINSNTSWLKYLGEESRRVHVFPVSLSAVQSPPSIGGPIRPCFTQRSLPVPASSSSPPLRLAALSSLPYCQTAKTGLYWMQRNFDPCSISWAALRARASARGCNATLSSLSGQFILSSAELWTSNRSALPTQRICSHLRLQ